MALDLSALYGSDKELTNDKGQNEIVANGTPLEIPLSDIEEDPYQPRREYSKKSLDDMASSIKERGIKQPISVRTHPEKPGKWIINFGSRRYRGSVMAKRKTIPAFIDEKCDSFDQVIENDQREPLTPMEMAIFIQQKIDEGTSQADIAKRLGRSRSVITGYMALIDPPECIDDAYRAGKCTSPRTLYELRQLHKKHPDEVEKWCKKQEEITRNGVTALADRISGKGKKKKNVRHDEQSGKGTAVAEKKKKGEEPDSLDNPLLAVKFEGRNASVLLNKKPSNDGMIGIRFEDGGDAEVEAKLCRIQYLTDAANPISP